MCTIMSTQEKPLGHVSFVSQQTGNQYRDTYVCRTWTLMDNRDTYGASAGALMFPVRGRGWIQYGDKNGSSKGTLTDLARGQLWI